MVTKRSSKHTEWEHDGSAFPLGMSPHRQPHHRLFMCGRIISFLLRLWYWMTWKVSHVGCSGGGGGEGYKQEMMMEKMSKEVLLRCWWGMMPEKKKREKEGRDRRKRKAHSLSSSFNGEGEGNYLLLCLCRPPCSNYMNGCKTRVREFGPLQCTARCPSIS